MYLQTSHSSCKLEIYNYNLQKVGVFQTAHSNKNIQAGLVVLLYHKIMNGSTSNVCERLNNP